MIILKEEMTEMEILKYPSFKFQYDNTLSWPSSNSLYIWLLLKFQYDNTLSLGSFKNS